MHLTATLTIRVPRSIDPETMEAIDELAQPEDLLLENKIIRWLTPALDAMQETLHWMPEGWETSFSPLLVADDRTRRRPI